MVEKLDKKMEFLEISILGNKKAECLDFEAGRKLNLKINELEKALEFITRIRGAGMSYQDMFIDAQEAAKFALGQIKFPVLEGRYDKEMTDLLRGGDNE